MKIFKTVVIIWFVLLGIILALLFFKEVEKTKMFKKFQKYIENDDDDDEPYR